VVDVREPEEYQQDNINAILFPLSKLRNFDTDEIDNLKNQEVIIHCRSGKRSMEACLILEQMGFTHTVNVEGGILEWRQKFGQENL
jgi:rhodanese-related sulfurtransferase